MIAGEDRVELYGADWCDDCRRVTSWLTRHNVPFDSYDTGTEEVRARAVELAGGRTNIPVLVSPDGTVLVEPTNLELATALAGLRRRSGSAEAGCR